MFVVFTSVGTAEQADILAHGAVAARLAACAQVDGPVTCHYWWQGRQEQAAEWRVTFKCAPTQLVALEAWVLSRHPYDTPEWIAVQADRVGEKYLSWALAASTSNPP